MKKMFPAIAVMITLSLLGLIYFQFVWLTSAHKTKEKQLKENIFLATSEAAERLMEDKSNLFNLDKTKEHAFSNDKMKMEILRPSVMQRFTKDEIGAIIRKSMNMHMLEDIPFEFAVSDNSIVGDQVQSDNFFKYFIDSAHNTNVALPLLPPPGSSFENLAKEEFLVVIVPHQNQIVFKEILWFILGSILFTLIIITAFFLTIRALLRQKKLSEIKSDFINNMTHEFKTPLATISLAVDALKNEKVVSNPEKSGYFIDIIKEENKRMNKQVETILQAALLDRKEVQLNLKITSFHQLINNAVKNVSLPLQEKNGTIELHLDAQSDMIMADELHIANIIANLLDNAIKYAKPEGVKIVVSTKNSNKKFVLSIKDNGIGMSKETLSRIFEKFYRAHTGNIHNVKGFGLGLSYVKSVVEAHQGTIKPESTLGSGSNFIIILPLAT
jgi:two-component system phosphate regulon sensor histidine kinase PhoR